MEKNNGHGWINLGNQFILLYLLERDFAFASAKNFSIAHAFECYFKAGITNKFDEEKAIGFGHKTFDMFRELKKDLLFLPNIEIEENTYKSYGIDSRTHELSHDEQLKIVNVQHLLFLFKYSVDLKYQKFSKRHNLKGTIS